MAAWPGKFLLEMSRVSCHHASSTAGFDGRPSGRLAWPLTPCSPELAAFLHGQGTNVRGRTPAAPVELTWLPEVRMAKWVIDGSKKPREGCACWVTGGFTGLCVCGWSW